MKPYYYNFVKYLFVGGSAACINWLIFFILFSVFGLYYLFAGFLSFVLATLWNFAFAKMFIFKDSGHSLLKESMLVYLVSFGGLLIDMGVLFVCVEWLGLHEMLSKILSTGVAFVFNFGMRQFVIYR
ncbi:GtrA family protein [Helicobacter marmotae]|uniref:GtrA family protein n=1 Tax=Helicobacter marmotae TaxID=152490 RepID=A0A3D8I7E3_9HELI|nr:GtrA family protein [Helicobacter marmotae]RDU61058.1 GtrA family protein [Helicobacter marmotae]